MKALIKVEKEVEIKTVRIDIPVRYEDEDMPYDFPFRKGDKWSVDIDIDSGQILDWPKGQTGDVDMKVCDEGSYWLQDSEGNTILSIEQDYIPNGLIPGRYGDYIELTINADGVIENWPKNPSIEDFTGED